MQKMNNSTYKCAECCSGQADIWEQVFASGVAYVAELTIWLIVLVLGYYSFYNTYTWPGLHCTSSDLIHWLFCQCHPPPSLLPHSHYEVCDTSKTAIMIMKIEKSVHSSIHHPHLSTISSLNLPLSSSSTTSREMLSILLCEWLYISL